MAGRSVRLQTRLRKLLGEATMRLEHRLAASDELGKDDARLLTELVRAWDIMSKRDQTSTTRANAASGPKSKKTADGRSGERSGPTADMAAVRAELERRVLRIRAAAGLQGDDERGDG